MSEQWKMVCKVKDIAPGGVRVVQRGLAWQELPGVALFRSADERFFALLDRCPQGGGPLAGGLVDSDSVRCPDGHWAVDLASGRVSAAGAGAEPAPTVRRYTVRVEEARLYLDISEMNAPASKAEAALAGTFSVSTHFVSA
jgi:nitrite reductase (NADH) small subunit